MIPIGGCLWSPANAASWVTFEGNGFGFGSLPLRYTVAPNTTPNARRTVIDVAGQSYTIEQAGVGGTCNSRELRLGETVQGRLSTAADCRSRVLADGTVADRFLFTATAGQQVIAVAYASTFAPVLNLTDSVGAVLAQSVSRLPAGNVKPFVIPADGTYFLEVTSQGYATLDADYTLTLLNPSAACPYALTMTEQAFDAAGGTGTIAWTTGPNCPWNVSSTVAWIVPASNSGGGSGNVNFQVGQIPVTLGAAL
ncbi:MAG: BACON domain-containing carbohydrate-binding protein [Blastocatellia bacterium]